MSATSVTLRGRVAAEARMLDACTVQHPTVSTSNPDTGVVTPTYSTTYTGKCRIRQPAAAAGPTSVGEAEVFLQNSTLSLPVSAPLLAPDDLVTLTASALTAVLVGRSFRVRAVPGDTNMTAARYQILEVTG